MSFDEFVDALTAADQGRALTAVAHAISLGREPRALTEELIGHLRNGFLSLMAPELVQVPSDRLDALATKANALGAGGARARHRGARRDPRRDAPRPRPAAPARGRTGAPVPARCDRRRRHRTCSTSALTRLEQAVERCASATPLTAPARPSRRAPRVGRGSADEPRQPDARPSGARAPPKRTHRGAPTPPRSRRRRPTPTPTPTVEPGRRRRVRNSWRGDVVGRGSNRWCGPSTPPGRSPATSRADGRLVYELPNEHHASKCERAPAGRRGSARRALGSPVAAVARHPRCRHVAPASTHSRPTRVTTSISTISSTPRHSPRDPDRPVGERLPRLGTDRRSRRLTRCRAPTHLRSKR